MSPSEDEI